MIIRSLNSVLTPKHLPPEGVLALEHLGQQAIRRLGGDPSAIPAARQRDQKTSAHHDHDQPAGVTHAINILKVPGLNKGHRGHRWPIGLSV